MAKDGSALSSDLDLIKELEQLRLKQKILIETLNKKNTTKLNQLLSDINSKLDFLVKIFKEANEATDETEVEIDDNVKSLLEKFDSFEKAINEKIDSKFQKMEDYINEKLKKSNTISSNDLPDPPSFKVDEKLVEKKVESLETPENKEKEEGKKGWFK